MEALIAPRGLIVDLVTPLKNNGAIDGRGLGRLVDRVAPLAQALFLASPFTGEGINLSSDQRLELLKKVLVINRQRQIPILFWVSQDTEDKTRHNILALRSELEKRNYAGQVFWVDTPLFYHSNRGLPVYYNDLCSEIDEPFILHNDPEFIKDLDRPLKRNNIRTSILKELMDVRNIVGLIFSGTLDRAHNYQRACRGRTNFRIYDGDETSFLDHPSMSGVVSMGADLAPKAWQKVTQSSLQTASYQTNYPDSLHQLWELGGYLRSLKDIYHRMPVAIVKEILSEMKIIKTPTCTFPTKDMEVPKREVKELMTRYGDYSYAKKDFP